MSFTKMGFPSAFASEGNPVAGGFPGEFDPYVHGVNDKMDIDDETGFFSFEVRGSRPRGLIVAQSLIFHPDLQHMARFAELAIAFAVEQAGWDNAWR